MNAQKQVVILDLEHNILRCEQRANEVVITDLPEIQIEQSILASSLDRINSSLKAITSITQDFCGKLGNDVIIKELPTVHLEQPITSEVVIKDLPNLSVDNELLINTLDEINTTLSSIPDGSYGVTFAGALFSVLAAFTFNIIYWWVVSLKKGLSTEVAKFEFILDRFEESATQYWIQSHSTGNSQDLLIKEMRIKADHRLLREATERIDKKFFFRKFNRTRATFSETSKILLEDLYDCATGGDFESHARKKDTKRCNRIIKLCTQIRVEATGLGT